MCENGEYQDGVDPRVHIELERLNTATDEINRLEVDLDEARSQFRQLLCDSTAKVDALRLKLGLCIEKAKPYYEARFSAYEALKKTQVAAVRYEKANSAHSAAREMVYLAEQGLGGRTLDPAWQEMLNHATQRVNEAERERGLAETDHKIACVKLDSANVRVQALQKELKRAITKSSLSIRRSLMKMSALAYQHDLLMLPYYDMKAYFNHLLEQQKIRVQTLESQVQTSKLTYAEALRNLEEISDEIHRNRSKLAKVNQAVFDSLKEKNLNSTESFIEDTNTIKDEYKSLPNKFTLHATPLNVNMDEINGYKNISLGYNISPSSPSSFSEKSDVSAKIVNHSMAPSHSSEWTEINLDVSSPEEDIPYRQLEQPEEKPKLVRQKTLPNPRLENEFSCLKNKMKFDTSLSNWISRSSAKSDGDVNSSRRQSLDNILGPTSEKVKEIFSQGIMMLNISSLTERRNSEPKQCAAENKSGNKKLPSPLEKTMTYLNVDDDNSDTESLSSVDMLTEEQINSLMLDKEIRSVCEQVLGTPMVEVISLPKDNSSSATTVNQVDSK